MRRLPLPPTAALALAAVAAPALVVLPTVARSAPAPHGVATRVAALAVHGVDARALAGDLAANPVPFPAPRPAVLTGELGPAQTGPAPRLPVDRVPLPRFSPTVPTPSRCGSTQPPAGRRRG